MFESINKSAEVTSESQVALEESCVENFKHHKAIVKETRAVKHTAAKKPELKV